MIKKVFSPHEFWLLHSLIFIKRAELLGKKIQKLEEVDILYQQYKDGRALKKLYGYDGYDNDKESLFDVMVGYLISTYPQKYTKEAFIGKSTLTRVLYLRYTDYIKGKNNGGALSDVKIGDTYSQCYADFLGIANLQNTEYLIEEKKLQIVKEEEYSIRFFEGYFYSDVNYKINRLLLKVNFNHLEAVVLAKDNEVDLSDRYEGKIELTHTSIIFNLTSCETGANGRLSFIMKLTYSPLARLKKVDICFATYCSLKSSGHPSCGLLGFEPLVGVMDESKFDGWEDPIPLHFTYFLAQNDITFQRKHQQTRMSWNYDIASLDHLKEQRWNGLEYYQIAKAKLNALKGCYKCLFVNTRDNIKTVSIGYILINKDGKLKIKTKDVKEHAVITYDGTIRVHGNIYEFSFKKANRKIEILLKDREYASSILYGIYTGLFDDSIVGGRVMLIKKTLRTEEKTIESQFDKCIPKQIKIHSREYSEFIEQQSKFYDFFSGQLEDGYIDDSSIIKYKTKLEEPLPTPKTTPKSLNSYIGTYQIFFLYTNASKKKSFIKSSPLSIDKDGLVMVKFLFSGNIYDSYQGRAFVQGYKLYLHLYNKDWTVYHGLLIWQLPIDNEGKQGRFLNQFIGSFSFGNKKEEAIVTGRIHVIQQSKDSTSFDRLEPYLYPCYVYPYQPLKIKGTSIDLRKEFMGGNYNYIKLPRQANKELDEKGTIRKENYANVFFKSAMFSIQKGEILKGEDERKAESIIQYARELLKKALEHGWNKDELDAYDKKQFEKYQNYFKAVLKTFTNKYFS